jgi:RNA polymerase sigma-70 factor, ECF subfamily
MSNLTCSPPVDPDGAGVLNGRFRRRPADRDDCADGDALGRVIARAQRGDRDALGYLYVRYAGNVYGFVASILQDEHEAEDVTQQVFAKLMIVLGKYEAREVPFLAWILTISRNVAIDHLRRQLPIPCDEVRESCRSSDPLDAVSVRDALLSLPVEQRRVVMLRHIVGLTPSEIAGRMGRTESSVHGLHHRGRGALRSALCQIDAAPAVMAG